MANRTVGLLRLLIELTLIVIRVKMSVKGERMKSYSSREIIKVLENDGWGQTRCNGDHHIFRHFEKKGKVIVPHPKKFLNLGL